MNRDTREVALAQQFVQLVSTERALDEDDDLVKCEAVQKFVELAVLFRFAELDVVLLETVQGELGVIIDVDFQRVSHELLANGTDLLREGSAEHHDLLISGGGTENLLDIAAHVLYCECGTSKRLRVSCLPI